MPAKDHLVIIDMQKGPLSYKPRSAVDSAVRQIKRLIDESRKINRPITAVEYFPDMLGPMIPSLLRLLKPEEVVLKEANDAFHSAAFRSRVFTAEKLLITGCHLEYCVQHTIMGALDAGKNVEICKSAVLVTDPREKTQAIVDAWEFLLSQAAISFRY